MMQISEKKKETLYSIDAPQEPCMKAAQHIELQRMTTKDHSFNESTSIFQHNSKHKSSISMYAPPVSCIYLIHRQ